jgi:hypothetical protein
MLVVLRGLATIDDTNHEHQGLNHQSPTSPLPCCLLWQPAATQDDMGEEQPDRLLYALLGEVCHLFHGHCVGWFMTAKFPAANQGMHTSVFLGVYRALNTDKVDKNVTSLSLGEPYIWGSVWEFACYCLRGLVWLDSKERKPLWLAEAVHKMLYNGQIPELQGYGAHTNW